MFNVIAQFNIKHLVPEFWGILQNFAEFYGIFQNFAEFCRILQNFAEFCRILQNSPEFCWTMLNLVNFPGEFHFFSLFIKSFYPSFQSNCRRPPFGRACPHTWCQRHKTFLFVNTDYHFTQDLMIQWNSTLLHILIMSL